MPEEYDYRLTDPSVERIDEIAAMKVFLAKASVNDKEAKMLFEKEKVDVFKSLFKKPKDIEVEIKSIKQSFEPYLIIGGKYDLRFLTERTYDIDLLDDTESVFILGDELIPQKEDKEAEVEIKPKKKGFFNEIFSSSGRKKPVSKPEIQLKGIEHVHIVKDIMEVRNFKGLSINPESLTKAELVDVGESFLKKDGAIIPKDYIDLDKLTSEITEEVAQRPEYAQRVLYEKLSFVDRKILLYPTFWAQMIYKGSKEKDVRLDAVTKVVETPKGGRFAPPFEAGHALSIKTDDVEGESISISDSTKKGAVICPECHSPIVEEGTVFCPRCGVKLK